MGPLAFAAPGPPFHGCVDRLSNFLGEQTFSRFQIPCFQAATTTRQPVTLGHPGNQLSCGQRNLCPAREWVCAPSLDSVSPLSVGSDTEGLFFLLPCLPFLLWILSQETFCPRLLTLHFLLQLPERRGFSNHMVSTFSPQLLGYAQRPAPHLSASFGHSGLLLRELWRAKAQQRWNKAFTLSWAGRVPRSGAPNCNHCGLPSRYP